IPALFRVPALIVSGPALVMFNVAPVAILVEPAPPVEIVPPLQFIAPFTVTVPVPLSVPLPERLSVLAVRLLLAVSVPVEEMVIAPLVAAGPATVGDPPLMVRVSAFCNAPTVGWVPVAA